MSPPVALLALNFSPRTSMGPVNSRLPIYSATFETTTARSIPAASSSITTERFPAVWNWNASRDTTLSHQTCFHGNRPDEEPWRPRQESDFRLLRFWWRHRYKAHSLSASNCVEERGHEGI